MNDFAVCPYCHSSLKNLYCEFCDIQYILENYIYHLYDPRKEHWTKCLKQLEALKILDPGHENDSSHDDINYLYNNDSLGTMANAGMFNICKELIDLDNAKIGLDCGCYHGWVSMQLSKYCPMIALDITGHKYYGLGAVPNMNKGITKVVADGCYMPFADNSFDFVIMVSSWHHLHDRLRGLNECYRVLKNYGKMLLLGECPMQEEHIEAIMQDGIRDYEGPPYTKKDLDDMFSKCQFDNIELLPFKYLDNMSALGYKELIGLPNNNGIIYGVK